MLVEAIGRWAAPGRIIEQGRVPSTIGPALDGGCPAHHRILRGHPAVACPAVRRAAAQSEHGRVAEALDPLPSREVLLPAQSQTLMQLVPERRPVERASAACAWASSGRRSSAPKRPLRSRARFATRRWLWRWGSPPRLSPCVNSATSRPSALSPSTSPSLLRRTAAARPSRYSSVGGSRSSVSPQGGSSPGLVGRREQDADRLRRRHDQIERRRVAGRSLPKGRARWLASEHCRGAAGSTAPPSSKEAAAAPTHRPGAEPLSSSWTSSAGPRRR